MNIRRRTTKIFAFLFLFFASYLAVESQDSIYQLEAGTKIRLSMDNEINSEVAGVNDTFTTRVTEPVKVRETIVLPVGIVIEGRVTKVERAASGGKGGSLSVRFETIRFENGEKREIEGVLVNELKAASTQKTSILAVIGGTAIGALLGAVSKADNGALIGAGIGAGAGTGVALVRKGKNVRIKTNEKFEIELKKQVTLPVQDY
ncbi:MAG TPA: hypothetical protein VNB22_05480 [Pyrinomonadaceae bacterium]|jgi:hypothetical protein|nr:hypothetical protein [Pyrinomonadaceae bacterium]